MERQRLTGLDFLRILATFMVVGIHTMEYGGIPKAIAYENANSLLSVPLDAFFRCGVNCFGLLSGYFMCRSRFKLMRILRLWVEVVFFGVLFTLIHAVVARKRST